MAVRIVTDSTCDLPAEVISRLGIYVLPLYINVGSESYLDGVDISREEFYQKLPSFRDQPTTAVPSPQKFRAIYNALADEGATEVLSIHISQTLSGICDVARVAARETTSVPVTVFDSRQLSLGTGFLVQTAAELARTGMTVAEILPRLEAQIKRTHAGAALDTLEFLRRSGRMNAALSTIGELLQLKPILKMFDGQSGVERVRTRKNALKRLEEMVRSFAPFEKIAFLHTNATELAHELMNEVKELLPDFEIWFEQVNPVLGAHLGPGVVGFVCISLE